MTTYKKTLYLCEKPSQARDVGAVLGIKRRGEGFMELNNGDVISWAVGHLLELADPEKQNPDWGGRWHWGQLPMIPDTWKYEVVSRTKPQFNIIKGLLKTVDRVVIATDAGREGELIAREILEYCKWRGHIERLWTSSLVASDIKAALGKLRSNADTYPIYEAAVARSHCDNFYGYSGSRGATLAAAVRGDFFPLGRVQTPTLAMVVRRDLEIKNFNQREYFELEAQVRTKSGKSFKMMHAPDAENRITTKDEAERRKRQAERAQGPLKVEKNNGSEGAPLAYSLPALQKDANRIFGFTAKNTLKLAQALYEKKAATYPRTDCQHLAASQMLEVEDVLRVVERRYGSVVEALKRAGVVKRKSTFDDTKLTDHHGIIPTGQYVELEGAELQLYQLICQRYMQLLGPDCKFQTTRVTMDANGVPFKATGKIILDPGWTALKVI
jgi:DNA topoisomerase III